EELSLTRDTSTAKARLQSFVDAYNSVAQLLHDQLNPAITTNSDGSTSTNRSGTLASDGALREVQSRLQQLISSSVTTGGVRSLADLGQHTQKDGTLSIDDATFQSALARSPDGLNAVFSTATTGVGAVMKQLVKDQVDPVTGLLTQYEQSLNDQVKSMDDDA